MAMRTAPDTWPERLNLSSPLEDVVGADYELYEEDGEFALTVDMPGFENEEIDLAWDEGVLNVATQHVNEDRGRDRTYHRRFRFPKEIDEDAITATYTNGVLEVTLSIAEGDARGTSIAVED